MGAAPIALLPHENSEAAGADWLIGEIDGLGPFAVASVEANVDRVAREVRRRELRRLGVLRKRAELRRVRPFCRVHRGVIRPHAA